MTRLLSDDAVERSDVAANCRMNRERELRGRNGYARELGFDVVDHLAALERPARWLDVCCGTARALFQAAELLPSSEITGIDLVGTWPDERPPNVRLVETPLRLFSPDPGGYDLVTCVHGLHYVGDKLGALTTMRGWLAPGGTLVANLDLAHVLVDGKPATARILRAHGLGWNRGKHLVTGDATARPFVLRFLGAYAAGPNYTGQPAIASAYTAIGRSGRAERPGRARSDRPGVPFGRGEPSPG